ncbi:hypothetical protein FRC02_011630 [Tulasnella sp. 418]|nr:hypothetical protein FRC02_011630 [Tulasnella sp. 418]
MTKHFAGSKPPATPRRRLPSRLSTTPRTRDDDDGQEFLEYCKFQPPVKSLFSEESISNQSESRIRVKVSRRSAGLEPWAPPVGRRNFAATKWNRKVPGEVATSRSTADFCWESYSTLVINNPEPCPLKRSIGFMGLYETWKKTPEGMEALKKQRVCYRQPGEKE